MNTPYDPYGTLAEVVKAYDPATLNDDFVASLKFMAKHETFKPIWGVVIDKLIDVGEYFRNREATFVQTNAEGKPLNKPKVTSDSRKRRKTQASGTPGPEDSTPGPSMTFVQDPNTGILVPSKK